MSVKQFNQKIHSIYSSCENNPFLVLLNEINKTEEYSYPQVIEEAVGWKKEYLSRSHQAKENILIILPHSLDLYTSYLGAVFSGMIPSMFSFPSPKYSKELYFQTIEELIKQAKPSLIVTYPELRKEFRQHNPSLFPDNLFIVPSDKKCAPETFSLNNNITPNNPSTPLFYQYSSGTTGIKKSVAITHKMLLWQIHTYLHTLPLEKDSRIVSWLPLYHDMGLIACYWLPLLTGIPLVSLSPFDWVRRPNSLLEAIEKYRATHCWLPNFAYNHLAKHVSTKKAYDLSSMKAFINCSEPILNESHELFYQRFKNEGIKHDALWACYAMAENTFAVSSGKATKEKILKKDFAEKIIDLMNNEALSKKLGTAARSYIQEFYSWDQKIKVLEDLYQKTIERYGNEYS